MFKFLRRVFIILVLLIIVFFVFRLVKPDATSRFVEKIRNIPNSISRIFDRSKDVEIIVNGETTSTSANFDIDRGQDVDDEDIIDLDIDNDIDDDIDEDEYVNTGDVNDLIWLEEIEKRINETENSGDQELQNGNVIDVEFYESGVNDEIGDKTGQTNIIGENRDTVVEDTGTKDQVEKQETDTQTVKNTSEVSLNEQGGDCGEGLSVQDCENFDRDLGWLFD